MEDSTKIYEILGFWFGNLDENGMPTEEKLKMWWAKDSEIDNFIRINYEKYIDMAVEGKLDEWKETPLGVLAFIIILDQFSRNIYRGTPKVFTQDTLAIETAFEAVKLGFDKELLPIKRTFIYMPFMHSELIDHQYYCVKKFEELKSEFSENKIINDLIKNSLDFAFKHLEIIKKYGRYPHRNDILNRESTPDEIEFLKLEGSSF